MQVLNSFNIKKKKKSSASLWYVIMSFFKGQQLIIFKVALYADILISKHLPFCRNIDFFAKMQWNSEKIAMSMDFIYYWWVRRISKYGNDGNSI